MASLFPVMFAACRSPASQDSISGGTPMLPFLGSDVAVDRYMVYGPQWSIRRAKRRSPDAARVGDREVRYWCHRPDGEDAPPYELCCASVGAHLLSFTR